jgi:hypothetical protein
MTHPRQFGQVSLRSVRCCVDGPLRTDTGGAPRCDSRRLKGDHALSYARVVFDLHPALTRQDSYDTPKVGR